MRVWTGWNEGTILFCVILQSQFYKNHSSKRHLSESLYEKCHSANFNSVDYHFAGSYYTKCHSADVDMFIVIMLSVILLTVTAWKWLRLVTFLSVIQLNVAAPVPSLWASKKAIVDAFFDFGKQHLPFFLTSITTIQSSLMLLRDFLKKKSF